MKSIDVDCGHALHLDDACNRLAAKRAFLTLRSAALADLPVSARLHASCMGQSHVVHRGQQSCMHAYRLEAPRSRCSTCLLRQEHRLPCNGQTDAVNCTQYTQTDACSRWQPSGG